MVTVEAEMMQKTMVPEPSMNARYVLSVARSELDSRILSPGARTETNQAGRPLLEPPIQL